MARATKGAAPTKPLKTPPKDPATSAPIEPLNDERAQALAERLNCLTSEDLRDLAGISANTEVAWRKRGLAPPYVMCGNRVLYPARASRTGFASARSTPSP